MQRLGVLWGATILAFGLIATEASAQRSTPVTVVNDPLIVTDGEVQPTIVQERRELVIRAGFTNTSATFGLGPSGPDRIRVIETVAASILLRDGEAIVSVTMTVRDGSETVARIPLFMQSQVHRFGVTYMTIQPIRVYLKPGQRLGFGISTDAAPDRDRELDISFSGYEIDAARGDLGP